jgi:hypothetical protein
MSVRLLALIIIPGSMKAFRQAGLKIVMVVVVVICD